MLVLIILIFNILVPAVTARVIYKVEQDTRTVTDPLAVAACLGAMTLVESLTYNHFNPARWVEIISLWSVMAGLCLMFYTLTRKRCSRN